MIITRGRGHANNPTGVNTCDMYVYPHITWYNLHLHNVTYQLYPNKAGESSNRTAGLYSMDLYLLHIPHLSLSSSKFFFLLTPGKNMFIILMGRYKKRTARPNRGNNAQSFSERKEREGSSKHPSHLAGQNCLVQTTWMLGV